MGVVNCEAGPVPPLFLSPCMNSLSLVLEMTMESTEEYWRSPALKDLLPDLSRDEQLRFLDPSGGRLNRQTKKKVQMQAFSPPRDPMFSEEVRDSFILSKARDALGHYNARHPGAEFDCVKPLMQTRVLFRNQAWFHVNFWARSRATNKIKRFFAEVHYKPSSSTTSSSSTSDDPASDKSIRQRYPVIPIVEICTIIEEPLSQYRRSCAFCPGSYDILHPKGCRKFVCGNDKDRFEQRLTICHPGMGLGRPFTCPSVPNALRIIATEDPKERLRLLSLSGCT